MVPAAVDPRWGKIISGASNPDFSALATRLAVTRLRREVQDRTKSPTQAISELHRFFVENTFAQRDVAAL